MSKLTRRHMVYTLAFCSIIVTGAALFFGSFSENKSVELAHDTAVVTSSAPKTTQQANTHVNEVKTVTPVDLPVETNSVENPFLEKETKARLIQIADNFSEDIQYPHYSKPIRNNDELEKYLPNRSVASSVALRPSDDSSPRISIKSSKHQYFTGENIVSIARIDGLDTDQAVSVSARLVRNGHVLSETRGIRSEQDTASFDITFNKLDALENTGSGLLRIIAHFDMGNFAPKNKGYEIGTPVNYVNVVASIDHVGAAQVNDVFLDIPVYVNTTNVGFHQVSANLYNAKTGKALLHLSAEKELLSERDVIPLQAHITALKAMKHEGPYELKDISLTRMPSRPDFKTEYGHVPQISFHISGYPFSDYEDAPYVDEQAQARLEFLTKLGGS